MKMSDRFNLPMKVDGYSVESTPMRHHTYPCEVVSDIECDNGEDAKAAAHAINNHDALVEALESMLDTHGEGNCRYVRGCCQEHFDLTGDGSCYIGKAKEVLKNAKGES